MAVQPLQIPQGQAWSAGVDFTPLAQLGQVYRQSQQDELRRQTLAGLANNNGQIDVKPLLASGDMSLAQLGINIMNNQTAQVRDARDFAFRQQEAQRAQSNSDRSYALTKENAEKPQYRTIKDASGNDQIIAIDGEGKPTTVAVPGAATGTAANPYSYGGKMNESQSKDAGYANRLFRAEGVLRDPKSTAAAESIVQRGLDKLPGGVGNYFQSPDYQRYDQAARDFINGVLRRESGAAISQSEFDNAYRQYLPRPGDSPEVLAEKQRNRQDAIASIAGGGGPNYRPPFTFDENGGLVRTENPQQGVVPRQQGNQPGITQEQYMALPKGATYTAPDGTQRVKR